MSEKANSFKLGLFVIAAFLLGAVALAVLGAGEFLKTEFLAETCFDSSVQGLDAGSPVKYRGITIGKVKTITGAAKAYRIKSDYVLVIMALDPDTCLRQGQASTKEALEQAVKEGLYVQLALQGLTGSAYLEMDFAQTPKTNTLALPWTPQHLYIPSEPSTITKLGDALGEIMKNLQKINLQGLSQSIQALFSRMNQKLDELDIQAISDQAKSLISEIRDTNQNLSAIIESGKFSELMTDAHRAVSSFGDLVDSSRGPVLSAVNDAKTTAAAAAHLAETLDGSLAPAAETLSKQLATLMESLDRTSRNLETLVWTNSGEIDDIMANLKLATDNLKQMSQDLRRYPSRLIFEKPTETAGENR